MKEAIQKMPYWVTIILAVVSTGGLTHIFNFWNASWEREDRFQELYKQELVEHAKTRHEVDQLKANLSVLNGNIINVPFPFWMKDRESVLVYLNHAYEDEILSLMKLKNVDVIGTRGEPMGIELSDFISNDQLVLRSGRMQVVREKVGDRQGTSYKWPIYKQGVIVLLAGMWIEDIED